MERRHDVPARRPALRAGRLARRLRVPRDEGTRFPYRGKRFDRGKSATAMDRKLDEALKGTFPASDPFDLS